VLAPVWLVGCASQTGRTGPDAALATRGFHLVERSGYQALYDGKGRLQRVLTDANRDGTADAQVLYWPNGRPKAGEIDTDLDGRIDRWETFDTNGHPARIGADTNGDGVPDAWVEAQDEVAPPASAAPPSR
jgi:hypothetical protein